jgi:hypothetical protein
MQVTLTSHDKSIPVRITNPVNRYAYQRHALFIPYALANVFAVIVVIVGFYSYIVDGVLADKKFQDIVSAAEDPEIVHVITSRKRSVTAILVDGKMVLRAGRTPDGVQREALRKVKLYLRGLVKRKRKG